VARDHHQQGPADQKASFDPPPPGSWSCLLLVHFRIDLNLFREADDDIRPPITMQQE
jgi:hypothetical protein